MKTAIIIPTYNRPEYLKQCFESLKNTHIDKNTLIYIIDDASTDNKTVKLIKVFDKKGCEIKREFKKVNSGKYPSLIKMYDYCFRNGFDYVISIDSDIIFNNYFFDLMIYYKEMFPNKIISGINSFTHSEKGTPRHPVIFDGNWYKEKKTCSGQCFGIDQQIYESYFKPTLEAQIKKKKLCYDTIASSKSEGVVCTVPSVAEHIGIESSLGHHYNPDVSIDFEPYINLINYKRMKVTVNIATYPARRKKLEKVIKSLLSIEMIDKIRVYLNNYVEAPDFLEHERIEYVVGGEDLKDTGKFFWAGTSKNEIYFTCDDDIMYDEEYFIEHKELIEKHNGVVFVTLHGKVLKPNPKDFKDLKAKYEFSQDCNNNEWINFPGTGVMAFDNSKYSIPLELFKYHGMTDLWIAKYCQENKISLIVRKHKQGDVKLLYNGKDTLWNKQTEMIEQHKEILDSVKEWRLFIPEEKQNVINQQNELFHITFVKPFSIYEAGKSYFIKEKWALKFIQNGKAIRVSN